jgi:DNA-binding LacI/PurR family transcriptional regulator
MAKKEEKSIKTIAKICGVSSMTVSRALRGSDAVKEATRLKIIETAEEIGYIRNPAMGRPVQEEAIKRSTVDLVVGTTGKNLSVFSSQLVYSLEQQLIEENCDCILRTYTGEYKQFLNLLKNIRESNSEIIMFIGSFEVEHLKAMLDVCPGALLIDNPGDPSLETIYESFCFDNAEAARIAVRHLLDCGRQNILLVSGEKGHFFSKEIEQGYRDAVSAAGFSVNDDLVVNADFTADSAYAVLKSLFGNAVKFDAVFTNDEMASGVYRAIIENGMKIPQDISVVGCDGLPLGKHLIPKLTTIKLDYEELAKRAIRHLLYDRKLTQTACRLKLLPELEVNESSCK